MFKRSILMVSLLILTSSLIQAHMPSNTIEFETLIAENGEQQLKIHLTWEDDPDIAAFKVYAVPSNTLLLVCVKNEPPGEQTKQLLKVKSKCLAMGIREATVQINDYLVDGDNGFRLMKVLKDGSAEEQMMNMKVDNYTGIYQVGSAFPSKKLEK